MQKGPIILKDSILSAMHIKWLVYTLLGVIADVLDVFLTYIKPDRRPQRSIDPSDVDQLRDYEIRALVKNATEIVPNSGVFQLTRRTVIKACQESGMRKGDVPEANALRLVFVETTIPVPRVRRVITTDGIWIVMDHIPGPTLAEVWPTLSTWRKICVGFTLRRYLRQLRGLKAPAIAPPGPLGVQEPYTCVSPVFGKALPHRGPFASYSELSSFFNERHAMMADIKKIPTEDPKRNERFDDSGPLVLTHQDLNLRNIIVGEDGRLWIINWAWAGCYPVWFEYTAMEIQNASKRNDKFWKVLIPFICGPYFMQKQWWDWMQRSLYYL